MKNLATYLSTAPIIAILWMSLIAGLLIEVNVRNIFFQF